VTRRPKKKRSFLKLQRFEECWCRDKNLEATVKESWDASETNMSKRIVDCEGSLSKWSQDRFGEIPKQIKITQKKLDKLNENSSQDGVLSEIRRQEARLDDL
jgi:hypothetical protein